MYAMTAIQAVFYYQSTVQEKHYQTQNNLKLAVLVLEYSNYSLFVNNKVLNLAEIICYSGGLLAKMGLQVHLTVDFVIFFDTVVDD